MSRLVRNKQAKKTAPNVVESQMTLEEFLKNQCSHCGGAHLRACPRVKRMVFNSASGLQEIEFWQDGLWDASNVLWPEDTVEAGESDEQS